jgi:glycosyltransferase involved in cell wall biosynthesis
VDRNLARKQLSDESQVKFYQKHLNDEYYSNNPYKILLTCKIYGDWSFIIVMKNLAKGLKNAGVDVSIAPEEYHNLLPMIDWEIKEMIQKPNDYWNRVVLRSCEGDHAYLMPPGKKRILHTTGESSILHKGWRDQLNNVDLVVTNSTFFRAILESNGVNTPIEIIPNSLELIKYNTNVEPLYIENLRGFNFYSCFSYGDRKGPDILIKAFAQEFSKEEDVTLYIQSSGMSQVLSYKYGKKIEQYLQEVVDFKPHAPILVNSNHIYADLLPHLIKNFQCNILSTKAEGFGNSIIETGAVGLPSIVTGYSGVTDFVNNDTGWLIDYKLVDIPLQPLPYFRNYIGGQWAEPSIEHLRELMRYVYENPEETKKKGQNAAEKAKNYDIEVIGKQLKGIIWS